MTQTSPGSYLPANDHWTRLDRLASALPRGALVVADFRVVNLHPKLMKVFGAIDPVAVVGLKAGEEVKSFEGLQIVLEQGAELPRSGTLICVGGGTVGDLCTVAAHLHKRGVRLVQIPTTTLAAVDSSLGGKGALNLEAGGQQIKNAVGVFHYAAQTYLCPELFETLSAQQVREGAIEAWKMAASLDAPLWRRWRRRAPALPALVREARRMKAAVCAEDPYEQSGLRRVLNFGHTFGHVFESLSNFKVSHGDAVGLGMLCALDVGRALGVTPPPLAAEVEKGLAEGPGLLGRRRMRALLARRSVESIASLLAADKKNERVGELKMVLLRQLGEAEVRAVPAACWQSLVDVWRGGGTP